eukprot:5880495-Pyramimonas_sp.AAC.1
MPAATRRLLRMSATSASGPSSLWIAPSGTSTASNYCASVVSMACTPCRGSPMSSAHLEGGSVQVEAL